MTDPNPYPHEHAPHRTEEEARQGRTPGIVRYVLGISLGLVILGMVIVYLFF